jgi:hypothetical protein
LKNYTVKDTQDAVYEFALAIEKGMKLINATPFVSFHQFPVSGTIH